MRRCGLTQPTLAGTAVLPGRAGGSAGSGCAAGTALTALTGLTAGAACPTLAARPPFAACPTFGADPAPRPPAPIMVVNPMSGPSIVISATFTADAIEQTVSFWMRELGFDYSIQIGKASRRVRV